MDPHKDVYSEEGEQCNDYLRLRRLDVSCVFKCIDCSYKGSLIHLVINATLRSCLNQKDISARLENHQLQQLLFPANGACLLSMFSRHAASWLSAITSVGLITFTLSLMSSRLH